MKMTVSEENETRGKLKAAVQQLFLEYTEDGSPGAEEKIEYITDCCMRSVAKDPELHKLVHMRKVSRQIIMSVILTDMIKTEEAESEVKSELPVLCC